LDLTGDYVVNAGTLPSIAYDPQLVFENVIRVGDTANFATPTVGEGIRICIERGNDLGIALGEAIDTQNPAPLKRFEAPCKNNLIQATILETSQINGYHNTTLMIGTKASITLNIYQNVILLRF
jgi:flavin-dependent dehydrogenase